MTINLDVTINKVTAYSQIYASDIINCSSCPQQKYLYYIYSNCKIVSYITHTPFNKVTNSYYSHTYTLLLTSWSYFNHVTYSNPYVHKVKHNPTGYGIICSRYMLWLQYIQFLFFFICNPSISNPGLTFSVHQDKNSSGISVYYQNVQGLIPFGNLSDKHPNLDMNKISELQSYIYKHNPDVIILNETWLKPSILDSEILPSNKYKLFRLDRSEDTHPVDPSNPLKYRRNGGGVLIAVNVSLSLESKVIPTKCAAELLAV